LGTTLKNQNSIPDEIKNSLNSGNACCHSVQSLLSSGLLTKNLKIRIYRNTIFLVFVYGCKTWLLTFRDEHRLRVFNNRVLRIIFGPKRDEVTGDWRKLHNEELNDLYSSSKYCSWDKIENNEMGGARSAYGLEETHIQGFGGKI
jgi:hypothetical protein